MYHPLQDLINNFTYGNACRFGGIIINRRELDHIGADNFESGS
jgi:hypothetical protein